MLDGFVKIDTWISPSCYMDVKVVTWICQSCSMYFLPFAKDSQAEVWPRRKIFGQWRRRRTVEVNSDIWKRGNISSVEEEKEREENILKKEKLLWTGRVDRPRAIWGVLTDLKMKIESTYKDQTFRSCFSFISIKYKCQARSPCVCVTSPILVCFFISLCFLYLLCCSDQCLCHVSHSPAHSSGLNFFALAVKGGWWACRTGLPSRSACLSDHFSVWSQPPKFSCGANYWN